MSLKLKTEIINRVQVNDLENFIATVTGYRYHIIYYEEWKNPSRHEFYVSKVMDKFLIKRWLDFKTSGIGSNEYNQLHYILQGLCVDDHLTAGFYQINVDF